MHRLTVGVMVLAGITLFGALGGHMMRQGARSPRMRVDAPRQHRVQVKVASAACPSVSGQAEACCDARAGD